MYKLVSVMVAAVALAGHGEIVEVASGTDLNAVRDRIRAWRAKDAGRANEKVAVVLAAGRYELAAPIVLGPEDSHVEWRAAQGAEVCIAGGKLVTEPPAPVTDRAILDLLPDKARGKVVSYDLLKLGVCDWGDYLYNFEDSIQRRVANTWGQAEFVKGSHPPRSGNGSRGRMELFVNDVPMEIARSARGVVYHTDKLLGKLTKTHLGLECSPEGKFTYRENIPDGWTREPDPHVCGCWCRDWAEQHQRIVRLDTAKKEMELSRPYHQYKYKSGAYFYGFNMLCELDEPGEWYIHRKTGKLIVWMPEDAGMSPRIELSMASRLFELAGVRDVTFRGIVFETCRNSALRMKDCADCCLADCTVRNVGQHALVVEDGVRCGARNCRFYGMGGGGAWLVDGNRESLKSSGHFVEGCDIHDFGRWNRMYRPGVCLSGVGMRAERNRIHDSPHAAILYFGCNLTMRSNEVFRVCSGSRDCGAFYTGRSWLLRGNRIEGNYIHDIIGLGGAATRTIYLDDSVAQVDIVGNRFERCTWALFLGGARECVITNNVFVDCPGAIYVDNRGMGWQKPHIDKRLEELKEKGTVYGLSCREGPYAEMFPAVKDLPGENPYEPVKNVIAHNRFVRGAAEWIRKCSGKRVYDPRWWRDGNVTDEKLREWGVFEDNEVDNDGLAEKLRIGAINWDCSVPASTYFGGYQTRSLGPEKFRDRTPYYAKVLGPDRIDYPVRTLAEYEVEMRHAIDAGIDYFAYCWYDDRPFGGKHVSTDKAAVADEHLHELAHARRFHRQSELRSQIGFCAILVCCGPYTDEGLRELASAMKDPGYETVDGRPLVYLFSHPWRDPLDRLVRFCRESGVPRPFSVVMNNHDIPKGDYADVDAFGAYACTAGRTIYEAMVENSLSNNLARTCHRKPVVPLFSVGWDPMPRVERPVPWCGYGKGPYHPPATESELCRGARKFAAWMRSNRESLVAGQLLVFAWNEFEEGGWICPNLAPDGSADLRRRDAFAKAAAILRTR